MAGRPRSFDRDHALDLALDAFWERGFDNTSIAELTNAIGITPPSLYAAFGDKQQLFAEASERYLSQLRVSVDSALALDEIHAVVERVVRDAAAHYTARESPRGCLVMSEPRLAPGRAWWRETFAARLRRARDEGDLAPGADIEGLTGYVDVFLAGLSARARDGASADELGAIVDHALASWHILTRPSDPVVLGDGISNS
jgi:AcrR family transcriptional regulator